MRTPLRGFAAMSPERRREISAMGGAAVPGHKRTFAKDRDMARAAGSKGGQVVHDKRAFSVDNELAVEAGRKGAMVSSGRHKVSV